MQYFTHNNHFRFGWGSSEYNFEDKSGDYWVDFGRASYTPTSLRSECVRAATLIRENINTPLLVCFSGGIDSEIIVRSFQEANISFEVVIMRLNYRDQLNVNQHDNIYAFDYVKKHNIPYHVVDIDLEYIIRNVFEIEADKYKGNYLGILIHTEITKQFPQHHCILGGGDLKLKRHRFNGRPAIPGLFIEEGEISLSAIEAAYRRGMGINNRFFMHTPELMLAWLLDPDVAHWIKYEYAFAGNFTVIDYHGIKAFVLYKHWPDMTPRPKFNGFEKLTLWNPNKKHEHDSDIIDILERVRIRYKNNNDIIISYSDLMNKLKVE
jgi:hypothetical protein